MPAQGSSSPPRFLLLRLQVSIKRSPSRSPGGKARRKGKGKAQKKGKGKQKRQKGAKGQSQRLVTIPGKGTVKGGGLTGKQT